MSDSTGRMRVGNLFKGLLGASVLALASSACLDSEPLHVLCDDSGCSSGLRLTFDRPPEVGTIIQVEVPGGTPWRVECGVDGGCDNGVFFPDFTPDYLLVRISSPSGEVVHTVLPEYEEFRPNGPDCPPTCLIATVELQLP